MLSRGTNERERQTLSCGYLACLSGKTGSKPKEYESEAETIIRYRSLMTTGNSMWFLPSFISMRDATCGPGMNEKDAG